MKRLQFVLFIAILLNSIVVPGQNIQDQKPNIILFYVDDLGWMDLSCQGSEFYETPAIDKLAKEGIRFTQGYTAHPRCLPARYALMTGRTPARANVPGSGKLYPEDVTMAEALKQGGYATCFAGKWHLLSNIGTPNMPHNQGFDYNFGGGAAGAPPSYFFPFREGESTEDGKLGLSKDELYNMEEYCQEGDYITDKLTDKSIEFIENQVKNTPDQPFFLLLSHYGVHTPFEAKQELIDKYTAKLKTMEYQLPEYEQTNTGDAKLRQDFPVYAAMVESIDQSMANLTQTLESLGIADNTIIIFTSDNGGLSTRGNTRDLATSNFPLRNGKGWLYEGGIREAFIIKWPNVAEPGMVSDVLITGTDIYPTVLGMAGLDQRPLDHIDGLNMANAILDPNYERTQPMFWNSPLARPESTGDLNSSAVRLGNYKLIDWYDENRIELFNIKEDIGEFNNLVNEQPEKAKELLKLVRNWRNEMLGLNETNYFQNFDFEQSFDNNWSVSAINGAEANLQQTEISCEGNFAAQVEVTTAHDMVGKVSLYQPDAPDISVKNNGVYEVSVMAKADSINKPFRIKIESRNEADEKALYISPEYPLTTDYENYKFLFTPKEDFTKNVIVKFQCAQFTGSYYFDNAHFQDTNGNSFNDEIITEDETNVRDTTLKIWITSIDNPKPINNSDYNIKLFPNPTSSVLNIENIPVNSSISLVNSKGQQMFTLNNSESKEHIKLDNIEPGIYILNIYNSSTSISKKLVIN